MTNTLKRLGVGAPIIGAIAVVVLKLKRRRQGGADVQPQA
jgi:hypothetical protein